ncbi:hypothetical protein SLEP1_g16442 [Rubroshorea leprosula]|uniref:non-specific serine/threonine protein kinase n=1 Tax=Rubroshorea leprosula TaxID=152421 RepID=A0AAV5IWJ1_9ROSI|nr:hypothetical protein SLEP1_g16442 [Rubroshorea leprosula]
MGNCGTREESAVVNAQVQQLHVPSSLPGKAAPADKKQNHNRSVSDLSDPSTPRNFEDSRKNAVLYTDVIAFTLYELETITKSFRYDYILGEGGFGTVYKGYIDENVRVGLKSLPVAVKVLNKEGLQGHREWLTEVHFLGQLRHPNLVKLIGYCCEDDHRLLVYEFMFRGSLENHLFRSRHFRFLSYLVFPRQFIICISGPFWPSITVIACHATYCLFMLWLSYHN